MKMKNFTTFSNQLVSRLIFAGLLCLGSITGAKALITVTLTSPNTTYTAGQNNTFTFNCALVYSGAEYLERYLFTFPAAITVVSGTPASGAEHAVEMQGYKTFVHRAFPGIPPECLFRSLSPTGCGAYTAATSTFMITFMVPANFTGPLVVNLMSTGDGFLLPAGSVDNDALTFQAAVAPSPCTITCPGDIIINLNPGACNAIVSYPLPTLTGDCFTGSIVNGFQQVFAPSAINYYQYDAGIFTNPPTPFTNAYACTFNSPTNTTLTLKSADVGSSPGPNYYYFNGVEWKNTTGAVANVSFNWTYNTLDTDPFWDIFVRLIGTDANNFSNNNFGNQLANWTQISNTAGLIRRAVHKC